MAATLVYFGLDTCHRLPVLVRAGYFVENSLSIPRLGVALDPRIESRNDPEAVLMADHDGRLPQDAIALIRARCCAPLILFRDSNHSYAESDFQLVIANLTPPEQWLHQIAALLRQNRLLRARPEPLRSQPLGSQRQAVSF